MVAYRGGSFAETSDSAPSPRKRVGDGSPVIQAQPAPDSAIRHRPLTTDSPDATAMRLPALAWLNSLLLPNCIEAIKPRRGPGEQIRFFCVAGALCK